MTTWVTHHHCAKEGWDLVDMYRLQGVAKEAWDLVDVYRLQGVE